MNSYKYIIIKETLELLFPGIWWLVWLLCPVFVRPVRPLCYWAIEISVHNVELAPTSNSRFYDILIKYKFGKFYRLEFCTEFFSYSSQTSSWCPMVADPTVDKYMIGCLTN